MSGAALMSAPARGSGRRPGQQMKEASRCVIARLHAQGSADIPSLLAMLTPNCAATQKRQYRTLNNLQALGYIERCNVDGARHLRLTDLGVQAAQHHLKTGLCSQRPAQDQKAKAPRPNPPVTRVAPKPEPEQEEVGGQWLRYGGGQVRIPPLSARSIFDQGAAA